jgi:hypothetical protein
MELDQDAYYSDWWLLRRDAFVNILHANNNTYPRHGSASYEGFLAGTPNMAKRKSNGPPQQSAEGIDMHQKHEERWRRSAGTWTL